MYTNWTHTIYIYMTLYIFDSECRCQSNTTLLNKIIPHVRQDASILLQELK